MRSSYGACVAAFLALCGVSAASATTSYGVRVFEFEAGFAAGQPPPDPSPIMFVDHFNNSDPLTGAQKTLDGGNSFSPASYSVFNNGFSPGSETNRSDWAGTTYGLGRLLLTSADARDAGPNNLSPPGTTNFTNRLTVSDVSGSPLLKKTESFEARAYWDFVTPDANSFYGLRLSDNPGNGAAYNDVLDLRVTRGTDDLPRLNLRRLEFDGTTITNTSYETINLQTRLAGIGKTLADVAYVGFEFHYNYFGPGSGDNGVHASFEVIDALGNDLLDIDIKNPDGSLKNFGLFNGEDFTRPSIGANWTLTPVPEPGTYALMLMGLCAIGELARRRTG